MISHGNRSENIDDGPVKLALPRPYKEFKKEE